MAKPPAGASLLFGALADSGKIKQRRNSSYRMVLDGVDEIDWFTDRPDRVEGTWKPQKLARKWDKLFATSNPNAQATVEVGKDRKIFAFEMFKPTVKGKKMIFSVKALSSSSKDKITGIAGKSINNISLFIDNASSPYPGIPYTPQPAPMSTNSVPGSIEEISLRLQLASITFPRLSNANMSKMNLKGYYFRGAYLNAADLTGADLTGAQLQGAYMKDANLTGANMKYATTMPNEREVENITNNGMVIRSPDNLSPLDLRNASLKNADLSYSTLLRGVFDDADLSGANLTFANLWMSSLTDANLQDVIWSNTTCPDGTINIGTSPCTAEQLNLA